MLPARPQADSRGRMEMKGASMLRRGSQIYGRSGWYKDLWAIMYAWYFPKGFSGLGFPTKRHDWKSVVVWIDNPAVETKSDSKYYKETKTYASNFAGFQMEGPRFERTYIYGSNTSLRFQYKLDITTYMKFGDWDGEYQDLIMWEQLTDAAREALNDDDNFGEAEVPFGDGHYQGHLANAWPL